MERAVAPIWQPLLKFFPKAASPETTVFLADGHWLKLLHVKGASHDRVVTNLVVQSINEVPFQDVVNKLRQTCQSQGIEPQSVIVANPSHLATTRIVSVPSADWAEIREIVELQIEKHTPYAKEEILTDFTLLETDASGYSKVMLVIAHQDVVNRALRIVEAMGWTLERVAFELEGLVQWSRNIKSPSNDQPLLVADLDAEVSTVAVLQRGELLFQRSLAFGMKQITAEASGVSNRLVGELRRSIEAFEAEGLRTSLAGVLLTGQVERLPELKAQVEQALELSTEVVSSFDRFALSETAVTGQQETGQASFAGLLGLAVGSVQIDLTPKPLRLHRTFELRARSLLVVGCQLIAVLVLISAIIVGNVQRQERYHQWLRSELYRTTQAADLLDGSLQQLELVRQWLNTRGQWLDIITELNRHSSDAIQWDAVDYVQGQRIVLKGTSREMPRVFDMVAALEKSKLFGKVEAKRVTKRKENAEELTNFELTCELSSQETPAKAL